MVTKQAVYDHVIKVLRNELLFDRELNPDTAMQALGLDSIQLMQLFVYIEEAFHFEFAADSPVLNARNASLNQFVDLICQSISPAA